MLLFELNAWENEWFVAIKALKDEKMIEKKVVEKKKLKKNLICEQYTNAWKLGANRDGQNFLNDVD
jgi:hypothetical protein